MRFEQLSTGSFKTNMMTLSMFVEYAIIQNLEKEGEASLEFLGSCTPSRDGS